MLQRTRNRRRPPLPSPPPRGTPSHGRSETQARILDAAERLFAEHGIEAVSVRAILVEAGVNAALANYHFGGREGLIEEVLRRRLAPLDEERRRHLEAVQARGDEATLEDMLRALYLPMFRWVLERPVSARFLCRVAVSADPAIRAIHKDLQREVLRAFADAMRPKLPASLTPGKWVVRFYFALGVGISTLLGWEDLVQSIRRQPGANPVVDVESILPEVVAMCAAALRSPPPRRTRRKD